MDAARTLEQESGTPPCVVLSTITDRMEIRKAVQSGQVEEAIDKVNDLNPEVLRLLEYVRFYSMARLLIGSLVMVSACSASRQHTCKPRSHLTDSYLYHHGHCVLTFAIHHAYFCFAVDSRRTADFVLPPSAAATDRTHTPGQN